MNQIEFNKESLEALARLLGTLAVSIATVFGWTLDAALVVNIFMSIISIAAMVYALWWRAANLTKGAQVGQTVTDTMKASESELAGYVESIKGLQAAVIQAEMEGEDA